jgi:hypothetical protein
MTAMSDPQFGPFLPGGGEMSCDPGDFPIFDGSTQSVAQTVGRL